ncbi:hypothetical protein H6G33_09375 [Calothrix sp. FACHB-1219]|uniref:hypothetical protein n=1 Tax=unclassified Calothrix TaxID=2619626 RepID=UPI001685C5D6|nr:MULTISPECIES: hypothetical protein [unclassified Calothrix]MBD2201556.1 hypothetical protein [Calothrix sp. FACHB-168]MBD2217242.1 hypothetical protein [Calothrix sp. FACHB-1219]
MGLLFLNQIFPGARTQGGDKTYAQCYLKKSPTYTITDDLIEFDGGLLEVEGTDYSFTGKSIDFSTLSSLVAQGQSFIIGAVPKYLEPSSRSAAEAAGNSYYVAADPQTAEAIAHTFFPSDVEQGVLAKGGLQALSKKVYNGTATTDEITIFNAYYEAERRQWDPLYQLQPFAPIGFDLVLAEVATVDNSPKRNALSVMSRDQFLDFKSKVGLIPAQRRVYAIAAANTAFMPSRKYLLKSAKNYASQSDAIADINGTVVDLTTASTFTASGKTHVAVFEYEYASNMPIGQVVKNYGVTRYLTKKDAASLGRIDPIYMSPAPFTLRFGNQLPVSKLTRYGDPEPLVKLTLGASLAVESVVEMFAK